MNKGYNDPKPGNGAATGHRGPRHETVKEKTAAWPGLPGKAQPRDRSGGTKKLKVHPKSEGI